LSVGRHFYECAIGLQDKTKISSHSYARMQKIQPLAFIRKDLTISEMVRQEGGRQQWRSDSIDGGLLYALYEDRICCPHKNQPTEIYRTKSLPFQTKYSNKNFGTYCTTIANRCLKEERYGNGITGKFREFVKQAREKYADQLKELRETLQPYNSEEDSTYSGNQEQHSDEELSCDHSVDESLSGLLRNSTLDIRHAHDKKKNPKRTKTTTPKKASKKTPPTTPLRNVTVKNTPTIPTATITTKNTPTTTLIQQAAKQNMSSQSSLNKYITNTPDGRVFVTWKLEANWDGRIFLNDDCDAIMESTFYPIAQNFAAGQHMKAFGTESRNNLFQSLLQAEMNAVVHRYKEESNDEPDIVSVTTQNSPSTLVITRLVFQLPFKVRAEFYDLDDRIEQSIIIDGHPTGDWASLCLKKQGLDMLSPPRTTIRRRTLQSNSDSSHAGTSRTRDENFDMEQEQEQQNRNNFVNTNNNLMGEQEDKFHSPREN